MKASLLFLSLIIFSNVSAEGLKNDPVLNVGRFENTTIEVIPQTDRGGKAVIYNQPFAELPENVKPNDATISHYQDRHFELIKLSKSLNRLYTIKPDGNSQPFKQETILTSNSLKNELASGYLLSYLYYDNGVIKYDGKAMDGRFAKDVNNETLFATHSTGKSINSYILKY